ncbi:MAG: cytochrome c3 family protein [Planctomycetota bacterium]|jgi:predicted CXXCH cytochrome family protein
MAKQIAIILGFVAVLAVGTAQALDPPHDATYNIACDDCHAIHGSLVPRDAEQTALCKSCHNPTDPNAGGMSDVNDHTVDGGATIIDCGSCHDVHGPQVTTDPHGGGQTAVNLKLIRGDTAKYVADACEPAIFQQSPGHFAFGSSNPPYNGVCQSCHISTTRHTNDGLINHNPGSPANNDHEIGGNCIACHSHADGFAASGGSCITCHDKVQDEDPNDAVPARRAVVTEFSLASRHVMGGTAADADCAVCHMESETDHKNGLIDLRNPDTGTALTGFTQFTRNTTVDTLETWVTDVQNNLCMKCHDAGGATATAVDSNTPLRPFSADGGRDVPDVFGAFDASNSFHHAVRGVGSNPYAVPSPANGDNITMEPPWNQDPNHDVVSCFDCHVANGHGDPNQRMLRAVIDFNTMETTTDSGNLPAGMGTTVEAFCTTCHKAGVYVSSSDPESVGSIFEYHGGAQNQHGAAGGNELGCMGCHGGIVDFSGGVPPSGNSSLPGNIHGGTFTWPTGTFSAGVDTEHFILGGWISGWMTDVDKGNPIGACGGGDCNHKGSDRRSGQDYTR